MKNEGKLFNGSGICLLLAIIVSMAGCATENPTVSRPLTNATLVDATLPLSLQAYVESAPVTYVINSITVGKTQQSGDTVVEITGSGLNRVIKLKTGWALLRCSIVTEDDSKEEFIGNAKGISNTTILFVFKTSKKPKMILFFTDDNPEKKYMFKYTFDSKQVN